MRFLTRLALYLTLLAGVQALVGPWGFPPISRQLDELVALRPSLLFLGDSSVFRTGAGDVDHRSTAQMLAARRDVRLGVLQGGAQSADLWSLEVDELLRRDAGFGTVVAVVNLRSFSPSWDLEARYQFTAERRFLVTPPPLRAFLKPLGVLKAFDRAPAREESFALAPVYDGLVQVGLGRDFSDPAGTPEEKERKLLLLFYMATLRADHRKVRSLVALADRLREARVRAIFYVSPIDVEKGTEAFGTRFRQRVEENVRTLERELVPRGVELLDLSALLPDSHFSYTKSPNEHLKAKGRLAVAEALAARLDP